MIKARDLQRKRKGNQEDDESDEEANDMITAMKAGMQVYTKQIKKQTNLKEKIATRKSTL